MSASFEKLHKSLLKFLLASTLEEVYKAIVEEVIYLVGLSYGSIYVFQESGMLQLVYSTLPKNASVTLRKNGYIISKNHYENPRLISRKNFLKIHPEITRVHFQSVMLVPLSYKNESLGVIVVYMVEKHTMNEKQRQPLKLFGALASLAIRNVKSYTDMQKALVLRDEFISLAAHELRTPLTSIHGYIQLLQKRLQKSEGQEKEWVEELYNQTYRLIYLVNELLEVTRISAKRQKFTMKSLHFIPVVERVIHRYQKLNKTHEILFTNKLVAHEDKITGDAEKLEHLVAHLLDNAEKFSSEGSAITVVLLKKHEHMQLKVSNIGEPIKEDEKILLFERFYKGKMSYETGMGLGLFLAKSIADYHKSKLEITSAKKTNSITLSMPTH